MVVEDNSHASLYLNNPVSWNIVQKASMGHKSLLKGNNASQGLKGSLVGTLSKT